MAKSGYVVGGLLVDYDHTGPCGIRVKFVRIRDGRIDPKDSYQSDWLGAALGQNQRRSPLGKARSSLASTATRASTLTRSA